MDEKALEARRAYYRNYQREWAKKNPDKIRASQERYWLKKAAATEAEAAKRGKGGSEQ